MNRLPIAAKIFLALLFIGLALAGLLASACGALLAAYGNHNEVIIALCVLGGVLSVVLPLAGLVAMFWPRRQTKASVE